MNIRKLDYIIVFIIVFSFTGIQLSPPLNAVHIINIFITSLIISAIIGTITNYVIKSKKT